MNKFILFFAITLLANNPIKSMEKEISDLFKMGTDLANSLEVEKEIIKQEKQQIIQKWLENVNSHPEGAYQVYKNMGSENLQLQQDIQNLLKGNTTEKEILNSKIKSLETQKSKSFHIVLTTAATAWITAELCSAYQKLSADQRWNSATSLKKAKLLATHTAKSMGARPGQILKLVKEKLQK